MSEHTNTDTEQFEELAREFAEESKEYRAKAKRAESETLEASHYGWADALDFAASRLAETVWESGDGDD